MEGLNVANCILGLVEVEEEGEGLNVAKCILGLVEAGGLNVVNACMHVTVGR